MRDRSRMPPPFGGHAFTKAFSLFKDILLSAGARLCSHVRQVSCARRPVNYCHLHSPIYVLAASCDCTDKLSVRSVILNLIHRAKLSNRFCACVSFGHGQSDMDNLDFHAIFFFFNYVEWNRKALRPCM